MSIRQFLFTSPAIFFPTGWKSLYVPLSAFWLDNGALSFLTNHETHQGMYSSERSTGKLLLGRISNFGHHKCPVHHSHSLDGEVVDLFMVRDQLSKAFPHPSLVIRISWYSSESERSHLSSSIRQGLHSPVLLSAVVHSVENGPERARGIGGFAQWPSSMAAGIEFFSEGVVTPDFGIPKLSHNPKLQYLWF